MHLAAAFAIFLAASVAAQAQGVGAIRAALSKIPEQLLNTPAPVQFGFLDVAALRNLGDVDGLHPTLAARAVVGDLLPHFVALRVRGEAYWAEKSHIDLTDIRYLAASGLQPVIWGLDSEATAASTIAALDAADFDAVGTEGMFSNRGAGASNATEVESFDPWRSVGRDSSVIAAQGNAIVQAIIPGLVEAILRDEPSMAENEVVNASLGGIEAALGDGTIVQAMLISPLVGLGGVDTKMLLNADANLDAMRKKLEAELEPGTEGIPSYLGGFIADAQSDQPSVLISLAYPDCATAARAAAQMADRFADIMPEHVWGDMAEATVEAPGGLCAATLNVTGTSTDGIGNSTFDALLTYRRHFSVLQIGKAE